MPYCTQDDILQQLDEDTLVQLTDDEGSGSVDTDVVTRAISDADATIDAYCQGRYSVPLEPVPGMIRKISVDISIYNLYSRRADSVPENRLERYKNAVRFLEKVASGQISLGAATPAPETTSNSVDIDQNDRIFTRDKMSGF